MLFKPKKKNSILFKALVHIDMNAAKNWLIQKR